MALNLVDQAEDENQKTEKLIKGGIDTDKNKIEKFKEKMIEVSKNFHELD